MGCLEPSYQAALVLAGARRNLVGCLTPRTGLPLAVVLMSFVSMLLVLVIVEKIKVVQLCGAWVL